MPNITSIGAGVYTSLAYVDLPVVAGVGVADTSVGQGDTPANWIAEFEDRPPTPTGSDGDLVDWTPDADAVAFGHIREFPNLGIPANIINVPQYGQATSSQISGQSDPPSLDFVFNYVPTEHAFINTLRAEGTLRLFRVRLSNAEQVEESNGIVTPYEEISGSGTTSTMREFSDFFFFGSVASFEIVPSLTDSNQLNVSLTIDGELDGPYSYTPDAALANPPAYA